MCGHVLQVVDVTTGEMLGRRSEGEVCVRGPQVMKGYLGNEKATSETLKDGWLHTGNFSLFILNAVNMSEVFILFLSS